MCSPCKKCNVLYDVGSLTASFMNPHHFGEKTAAQTSGLSDLSDVL